MRATITTLLSLALVPAAPAQESKLPPGSEILDRFVEHAGGRVAIDAIKSRVGRGRFMLPAMGIEGPLTISQVAPDKFRMAIELGEFGTVEMATNGEDAWEVSPSATRVLEGDEKTEFLLRSRLGFDVEIGTLFTEVTTLGVVPVDGRSCFAVRMVSPLGHAMTRYFDRTTYELVQEKGVTVEQTGVVTGETIYEDYREVGGVRLPFKTTKRSQGQTVILELDHVEHNVEIAPETFELPVAVRRLLALEGPKPGDIVWLRKHAVPFETVEAENGFEDLEPLRAMIGDARIVSLGESTHGSREIFQMKHRLLEFLATEMGFRIFSIEASLPESFRVSDYVVRGEGDPRRLIGGMYFWTWNTEEVLDMVEWMRGFNQGLEEAEAKDRLFFTGFDMQFPDVALQIVKDFAGTADPELRRILQELPSSLRGLKPAVDGGVADASGKMSSDDAKVIVERAIAHLEDNHASYDDHDPKDVEWAVQNARVVRQYLDMARGNALADRDRSMAENVRWILEQNPDDKIVLWAHNLHVSTLAPWMGHHLEAWYDADYISVGFATTKGRYTAIGDAGLVGHDLQPPPPTSIEAFFVEAGIPRAIVDLRQAEAETPSHWLTQRRPFRSIGAMAMAKQFTAYDVTELFELLIYIEESGASVPLR